MVLGASNVHASGVKILEVLPYYTAPVITSVSPITATATQIITISGSGFGNTPPQTVQVGDGSVDTQACNVSTPSLVIKDNGPGSDSWQAGLATCSGSDSIGIYIMRWSDSEIVLAGFGSALGTYGAGQWNIALDDSVVVYVWGPNGNAYVYGNVDNSAQYQTTVTSAPMQSSTVTVTTTVTQTTNAGSVTNTITILSTVSEPLPPGWYLTTPTVTVAQIVIGALVGAGTVYAFMRLVSKSVEKRVCRRKFLDQIAAPSSTVSTCKSEVGYEESRISLDVDIGGESTCQRDRSGYS